MANETTPNKRMIDNVNEHGLHWNIVSGRLRKMKDNVKYYRPHEIARDLVKLAHSIDPQITITTAQQLDGAIPIDNGKE